MKLILYRSYSQLTFTIQTVVLTADVFQLEKYIYFLRKLKNVSCEYLFEWLKLNFASCVVHQPRSYDMVFVNWTYDMIIKTQFYTKYETPDRKYCSCGVYVFWKACCTSRYSRAWAESRRLCRSSFKMWFQVVGFVLVLWSTVFFTACPSMSSTRTYERFSKISWYTYSVFFLALQY